MSLLSLLAITIYLTGLLIYLFRFSNFIMYILALEIMAIGISLLVINLGFFFDDLCASILFISILVLSGVDLVLLLSYT